MDREKFEKFMYQVLQVFVPLAMAIAFYFILLRFSSIKRGFERFQVILTPFIYGAVMAYLLKTPCNFFDRHLERYLPEKYKKHTRGLSVLIVMVIAFYVIYTLLRMVIPQVIDSIITLANTLPGQSRKFFDFIQEYLNEDGVMQNYVRPFVMDLIDKIAAWSKTDFIPMLQDMMGGFTTTIYAILDVLYNIVIGVIICVYALCARKKFAKQSKAVLYAIFKPHHADKIMDEILFVDKTFDGFLSGKILDSAIVGLICYAFCCVMVITRGMSNIVLISLIIGVTNVIPYFGPFIGAVPCTLLILMADPVNALIFVIFILILQQIDGNVLGPKLLAGSVGLSGFWVLFSITLFGGIFGFIGILVGVPVFAVIYDLAKKLIRRGLKRNGRLDLMPEDEETIKETDRKKEKKKRIAR
ncbi:MAG: AI-2E family transporter [Muricoprocola sp.]